MKISKELTKVISNFKKESDEFCSEHTCSICPLHDEADCDIAFMVMKLSERGIDLKEPTDWATVPVDTKVLVRETVDGLKHKRYFAEFEDGKVHTYLDGRTSFSTKNGETIAWNYAELAEEEQ